MSAKSTSPQWPSVMWVPTAALQLPSAEVGNPEKLQVQPGWQLQNSYPLPVRRQAVVVSVVVIGFSSRECGDRLGVQDQQ